MDAVLILLAPHMWLVKIHRSGHPMPPYAGAYGRCAMLQEQDQKAGMSGG